MPPVADEIDSELESSPPTAHESGRKLDFWIIGALSLVVAFLLVDAFVPGVDDDVSVAGQSIVVLEVARQARPGIGLLLFDPLLRPYQADPRFAAYCRKVGLPVPVPA